MIYLTLAFEFFKIGLFSIGGGMATLPFLMDLRTFTGQQGIIHHKGNGTTAFQGADREHADEKTVYRCSYYYYAS